MSYLSHDIEERIYHLYDTTELPITQIAKQLDLAQTTTYRFIWNNYSMDQRRARSKKCFSNAAKLKNTNHFKFGIDHQRYVEYAYTNDGYILVLKPEWYTGRKSQHRAFLHHIVMCDHMGITEIPRGYCVHHVDFNKLNNSLDNLEYMTLRDHGKLHRAAQLCS